MKIKETYLTNFSKAKNIIEVDLPKINQEISDLSTATSLVSKVADSIDFVNLSKQFQLSSAALREVIKVGLKHSIIEKEEFITKLNDNLENLIK